MNKKPWYKSKSVWANVAVAVGAVIFPEVVAANPEETAGAVAVLNILLRLITRQPVSVA